jgi:hypothetical protein
MNPLQIAAIVAQLGLGGFQMLKGNSLANTPRPTESVPQGVVDATNLDRSQAASPFLPNYGFASNQIAGNTASAYNKIVQNSPSSASTLGNIGNLYANQNNQQQDLLMKGIDRQDKMKSQYAGQLNTLGQYQNQDWQWNEADPYLAAIKAANMQTTTGEKNIFAGLESGASGTMLSDLYNKLLGKNNVNPTTIAGNNNSQYLNYGNTLMNGVNDIAGTNSTVPNSPLRLNVPNSPTYGVNNGSINFQDLMNSWNWNKSNFGIDN